MSEVAEIKTLIAEQNTIFEEYKSEVTKASELGNKNSDALVAMDTRFDQISEGMVKLENVVKRQTEMKTMSADGDVNKECYNFLMNIKQVGRGKMDEFNTNELDSNKKAIEEFELQKKSLAQFNERDDAAGGVTVMPVIDSMIGKLVREFSQARGVASVASIPGNEWQRLIRKQTNGALRRSALSNFDDATKSDRYGLIKILVDDLFSIVPFTDNLEMDTSFNVVQDILSSAAEDFAITEGEEFINNATGEGLRGLLSYTSDTATGNSFDKIASIASAASSLAFNDVWNILYSLKTAYRGGSVAFCNRLTFRELRKLRSDSGAGANTGQYLWEFNNQIGQPATIGGVPIREMPELVAPAANGTFTTGDVPLIYGDFKAGYKIVDAMGIVTTRDNLTQYPDIVYKLKKRSGGGLTKGEAIKKLTMV